MAAPAFWHIGSLAVATSGNASVSIPSGTQVGDFLLLIIENDSASAAVATPTSGGGGGDPWTQIGTPVTTATTGATKTRLAIYRKFAAGTDSTNTTVGVTTDHVVCAMYAFKNVNKTNPINVGTAAGATGNSGTTAVTSITYPSITTTVDDCLVLGVVASGWDAITLPLADNFSNANLTSIGVTPERSSNLSNGGGFQLSYGVKELAGATGTSTENLTGGSSMQVAYRHFALAPEVGDSCGMLIGGSYSYE